MITSEILRTHASLNDIGNSWNELFRRAAAEPSLSFEWSRAMLRNHLHDSSDWFVVVLRRQGALVGVVPMMFVRNRVLGREIVSLQPIQHLNNTHGGLLIAEPDVHTIGAWIDALRGLQQRWDVLQLIRLLEGTALPALLADAFRKRGMRVQQRWEQPSFYLPLPGRYEDYLATRSSKFRNYLKRCERKLATLGTVEFDRLGSDGDPRRAYEELITIERESWKHAHGTAISAKPHQTGFYRDLIESTFERGTLHLTFLRVQGRVVAYNLGLLYNDCYYYLKTSFREDLRSYGVATIGRARLIQRVIAEQVPAFDFPGEPYEWEQQWTDQLRWHQRQLVYNATPRGWALWALNGARERLRGRKDERRLVFRDPRAGSGE